MDEKIEASLPRKRFPGREDSRINSRSRVGCDLRSLVYYPGYTSLVFDVFSIGASILFAIVRPFEGKWQLWRSSALIFPLFFFLPPSDSLFPSPPLFFLLLEIVRKVSKLLYRIFRIENRRALRITKRKEFYLFIVDRLKF